MYRFQAYFFEHILFLCLQLRQGTPCLESSIYSHFVIKIKFYYSKSLKIANFLTNQSTILNKSFARLDIDGHLLGTEGLPWLLDFDVFGIMLNASLRIFSLNSSLNVFCFLSCSIWCLFRPGQKPENKVRVCINNSTSLALFMENWGIPSHLVLRQAETESTNSVCAILSQFGEFGLYCYYNYKNIKAHIPPKLPRLRTVAKNVAIIVSGSFAGLKC